MGANREQITVHLDADVLIALRDLNEKMEKGISEALNCAIRYTCDLPIRVNQAQDMVAFLQAIGYPWDFIKKKCCLPTETVSNKSKEE